MEEQEDKTNCRCNGAPWVRSLIGTEWRGTSAPTLQLSSDAMRDDVQYGVYADQMTPCL